MADLSARHAADQHRRRTSPAIRAAFAQIPQLALLEIMRLGGVAERRAPDLGLEANGYENGFHACAIEILTLAGFDASSILVAAITGSLEGEHSNDRSSTPGAITDAGPDADARAGPDANPDY